MAKKGGAHHGGAWKVAYADFVTAMMALFMVLWICGQNEEIKKATSRFFQDPYNALPQKASGLMTNQIAGSNKDTPESDPTARKDTGYLQALARDFYRLLNVPDEEDRPVTVEITSDGLKITLYNRARRPLFVGQTAEFTEWGRFVVQTLAWLIERHDFRVYIDGHSERAKFEKPEYGPWELSSDRANAARRSLEYYAVDGRKFERVTGFGDTISLPGVPPEAEGNARITVSLSMQQKPLPKSAPAKKAGAEKGAATAKEEAPATEQRDRPQNLATKSH